MASPTFLEQMEADLEMIRRASPSRDQVVADLIYATRKIDAMARTQDYSSARYPLIHMAALAAWLAGELEEGR